MQQHNRWLSGTLLVVTAVFATTACDQSSGPSTDSVVRPATLIFAGDSAAITVPDSAIAGAPVAVTVRSEGSGCTTMDNTQVDNLPGSAVIRPFVREPAPAGQVACPGIGRIFTHEAQLVFTQVGNATIVVHGLKGSERTEVSVTRSLRVVAAP